MTVRPLATAVAAGDSDPYTAAARLLAPALAAMGTAAFEDPSTC